MLFESDYELLKECISCRKEEIRAELENEKANEMMKGWNEIKIYQLEQLENKLNKWMIQ